MLAVWAPEGLVTYTQNIQDALASLGLGSCASLIQRAGRTFCLDSAAVHATDGRRHRLGRVALQLEPEGQGLPLGKHPPMHRKAEAPAGGVAHRCTATQAGRPVTLKRLGAL